MQPEQYLKNPPQRFPVVFGAGSFLLLNLIGIALAMTAPASMRMVPILIFFSLSLPVGGIFFIFNRVLRPKGVTISDPLIFHYLARAPRLVPMDNIEWVNAVPGDLTTRSGRNRRWGGMKAPGFKYPIPLTYEVAYAIKEEYAKKHGQYPPPKPANYGMKSRHGSS
jgi:hypothetical protein